MQLYKHILMDRKKRNSKIINGNWIFSGFPFYDFRKNAILWIVLSLLGGVIGFVSSIADVKTVPNFKYEFVDRKGWSIKYTKRKSGIERLKKIKSIEDKAGISYNGGSPGLVFLVRDESSLKVRIIDTIDSEYIKFRASYINETDSRFTGYTHISNICIDCNSIE